MYKLLSIVLPIVVAAQEDFISHYEYGEMLYHNPRGVSCAKCHGEDGKGKVIARYRDDKGEHALKGPDISDVDYVTLIEALNRSHSVMPRYYLTDEEIRTIYDFLKAKNKKAKRRE